MKLLGKHTTPNGLRIFTGVSVMFAFAFIASWGLLHEYGLVQTAPLLGDTIEEMVAINFAAIMIFGNLVALTFDMKNKRKATKGNHSILR